MIRRLRAAKPASVAAAFALLTAVVVGLSFLFEGERLERLKYAVEVAGGAAAIYSAFYAGEAFWSGFRRDCQAEAFNVLKRYDSLDVRRLEILAARVSAMEPAAAVDAVKSDPDDYNELRKMMAVFDDMAAMTRVKFVDEEILRTLASRYIAFVTAFMPFIRRLRELKPAEGGVHGFARDIEAMRDAWASGRSYAGRPPPKP